MKLKTIGVLGGLGPQATIDFYSKVLSYCQARIKAHANKGYPEMIIYNCNFPPFSEKDKSIVNPKLINAAKSLEKAGADFIVMPSVTPHIFYDEIKKNVTIPIVNAVEEIRKNVVKKKSKMVGLLGTTMTIKSNIIQSSLKKYSIKILTLDNIYQNKIEKVIFNVMESKINPKQKNFVIKTVNKLKNSGASLIILGCTELPVLLGDLAKRKDVLDVTEILAKVAVDKVMR